MARYKTIDTSPRFRAVDLEKQLLPGSFAHAVHHLLDHDFDLSGFDARYRNDATGASAYPPGMLLKVILCAYAEGVVSSRGIERLCREHVTFIALSGDSAPHFTTLAAFVSGLGDDVAKLFAHVLCLCDRQGLIGRQMFAIDGVKLPSNASKSKSGRRADFLRQAEKMEAAATAMLERHRANDDCPVEADLADKEIRQRQKLTAEAKKLRVWLADHPNDRPGTRGSVRLSNRTDNESAKMATDKGVIQGYCGVAAVDGKHQIIVDAQAHGTGSEQALLMPPSPTSSTASGNCRGEAGESRCNIGSRNSGSTYAAGWATSASPSITDRFPNWMNGYADVCACATGNSGVCVARRSATFWRWESTSGRRS
jgi:transposase